MGARGFTLLEVMVVVAILAAVGLLATVHAGRLSGAVALDAAAREVAEGLRFARAEAMRQAEPRGFRVIGASAEVEAFAPSPGVATPLSALRDPLSKRSYRVALRALPGCRRLQIHTTPLPFSFLAGGGVRGAVLFDAQGIPHTIQSGAIRPLGTGQVVLELDGVQRSVKLSPAGRVTVQ